MKKYAFLTVSILAILALGACSDSDNITNVPNIDDQPEQTVTAGEIHTEFLEALYAKGDFAKRAKSSQVSSAKETANQILVKYGLDPMTDSEVEAALQRGRDMAQQDPVELVRGILSAEEMKWWDRFSFEAKLDDARKVYNKHCQTYGAPIKGSLLDYLTDVSLSSVDFWPEYRKNDTPKYHNPYVPSEMNKGWRGVLRFAVAVVVDGGSGALVSGGGPVASGVVGGLASTGADHLIFGDD